MFYDGYGLPVWDYNLGSGQEHLGSAMRAQRQPFRYKGQAGYYADAHTGLYYCHHRYYSPVLARWMSVDPIGLEGGFNVYEYCGGDPVNQVDPSGLERYGLYAWGAAYKGPERNSFQSRAIQGAGRRNAKGYSTSGEFFDLLSSLKDITQLDIHTHGSYGGFFSGTPGDWITRGTAQLSTPATRFDGVVFFALLVKKGAIDLGKNAVIRLFACHQDKFAQELSAMLGALGRKDVIVIGARGSVSPLVKGKSERQAFSFKNKDYPEDDGLFYFYRNGKVINTSKRISYR